MAVTLKDIAESTGLSRQTVAFILGDRPHLFREETRQKVLEAARRLGYRPNSAAAAMSRGKFHAIGILQASETGRGILHYNTLSAILEEAAAHDLHLNMGKVADSKLTDEASFPKLLREWAVDGLIISYVVDYPRQLVDVIERLQVPSIWLNTKRPHDCVYADDYGGIVEATKRLLARGHSRIAFLRFLESKHYSVVDRWQGYCDTMQSAGLAPRRLGHKLPYAPNDWKVENERVQALSAILDSPDRPSAIIVDDDAAITALLHLCLLKDIRLGRDLSVTLVSRDKHMHFGFQPDTAVIPTGQLGHAAVPLLLRKIEKPAVRLPPNPIPYEFLDGSTVGPPASM